MVSCAAMLLSYIAGCTLCAGGRGAALRTRAKHVSPLVVRQLWKHAYEKHGSMVCTGAPVEEALPLLQQPMQQLLAAAVRAAGAAPS